MAEPRPLAVADRLQIVAADPHARTLGIVPGLGRAAALALSPSLRLHERDSTGERQALEELALRALRFTPSVSLETGVRPRSGSRGRGCGLEPAGLLLEVQPSLRYFGGHCALLRRIRAELAEAGIDAAIGWAPTPTAAWLLARRRGGGFGERGGAPREPDGDCRGHDDDGCRDPEALATCLGGLSVELLESAREHLESFDAAGLRCIADLLGLPRSGLARRFGQPLLDELDRALGRRPDPRLWYEPPACFALRLELPVSLSSAEAVGFAARRLIAKLALWLEALQKGARSFELAIEHGGYPDTLLAQGLAEPAWQAERLFGLLRERLATIRLPAPARALRLRCIELADAAPATRALFADPAGSPAMLGPLLERLQARLGRERVQVLQAYPDHRPEAAWRTSEPDLALLRRPASLSRTHRGADRSAKLVSLPRPLWLLDKPEPLVERDGRPWRQEPLTLLAGPERIESGWWDERPVQRDYFVAEDSAHRLLWIYRERLPASLPDRGGRSGWFLHGCFG